LPVSPRGSGSASTSCRSGARPTPAISGRSSPPGWRPLLPRRAPRPAAERTARDRRRTAAIMSKASAAAEEARVLGKALQAYRGASTGRSFLELAVTLLPLAALATGLAFSLHLGIWWLYGLLILPAAAFVVRAFMIQHDCGHGAFFAHRRANDWTGRMLGVLTLTPYDHWRRTHAEHHASAGNLERRGIGDVLTLTVEEYHALPWWKRLGYRLYRNPA